MKRRKDGRFCRRIVIDGETCYFYSSAASERAAEKDICRQMLEFEKKRAHSHDFELVADKWCRDYLERVSDLNFRKSKQAAYGRITEYFYGKRIDDICAPEINIFLKSLAKKQYAQKTVAAYKSILNMIFVYALLEGYISYNPIPDVKLPPGLPKTFRQLPTDEALKVVSEHYADFDLFPFFLLYTGLRRSEALAVRREDIDFKKKLIFVKNHIVHDGNTPVFEPVLKTEAAGREVILLDRLSDAIPHNFKGFLFSMDGDGEKPLTKSAYRRRWDTYCRKYNVEMTAHMLRHGYATMLFEAGIDVKDAQELMGHTDINLTRQIYTHVRAKRKEETAKKLNSFSF